MTDANATTPRSGGPSTVHNGTAGADAAPRLSPTTPGAPFTEAISCSTLADRLEAWTDAVADHPLTARLEEALSKFADRAIPERSPARAVLSGDWLGQPLHPILNDVPTGLWTSATILDVISWRRSAAASRRLIGLGILTAVPTAAAGLTDLSKLDRRGRRAASVHVALNLATLMLYLRSYGARRRRKHLRGALWALAGAGLGTASGVLGGQLAKSMGHGGGRNVVDLTEADVPPV